MKTNLDLLGRPIRTVRVVAPIVPVDDRDGRTLSLEDQVIQRANAPRHYDMLAHIKDLEARASQREDRYGREFLQGHADRLKTQLKRRTNTHA